VGYHYRKVLGIRRSIINFINLSGGVLLNAPVRRELLAGAALVYYYPMQCGALDMGLYS
jgi:hypothetical protein